MPTLLLIGEQEKIYNPKKAMQRAKQFMPSVTADFIPHASHLLTMEQPDLINARILDFLARQVDDIPFSELSGVVQERDRSQFSTL